MIPFIKRLEGFELKERIVDWIKFRHATPSDAEKMAELYRTSFPEHILVHQGILSDPVKLREEINANNKYWIVAENPKKIVGCAAIELHDWNKSAEIERVVVLEKCRKKGIGKEICRTLVDCGKEIGVEFMFAYCRGPQKGMQRALEALDFQVMGIMPIFYVMHNDKKVRENFVFMGRLLDDSKVPVDSWDNLIPQARTLKEIVFNSKYLDFASLDKIINEQVMWRKQFPGPHCGF